MYEALITEEKASLTSASTAPIYFASKIDTPTRPLAHRGSHIQDQSPLRPLGCGSPSHGGGTFYEQEWAAQNRPKVFQFVYERPSLTEDESSRECDNEIECHDGTNSVTILSEVLGPVAPIQLTQSITRKSNLWMEHQHEIAALGDEDASYLHRKGAFMLPRPEIWWVPCQIKIILNANVRDTLQVINFWAYFLNVYISACPYLTG
jgi:hypothetical protein